MPFYSYVCNKCNKKIDLIMSINEYEKSTPLCQVCQNQLTLKLGDFKSQIEKSNDQILQEIKDDVDLVMRKIAEGDQKTIDDIYGDRENQYL